MRHRHPARSVLLLASIIALTSCQQGETLATETQIPASCVLRGPSVSPVQATVSVGGSLRLEASAPCGFVQPIFRWVAGDTGVASVDFVTGIATGRRAGTTQIITYIVQDPNVRGAMTLRVDP